MFRLVNFNPMFPIGTPVPKVIDANIKKLKAPFQVQYVGTKPKTFKNSQFKDGGFCRFC